MAGTADWGTVRLGRLVLREGFTLTAAMNGQTGQRTFTLTGEESSPPLTVAQLQALQEDILGIQGQFLPVTFSNKTDHNGWYQITDLDSGATNWTGEVAKFTWQIQAVRAGAENVVDLESRAAYVVRTNVYALTGERWHAPAAGAVGYYTGSTAPGGSVSRPSADGTAITVYRSIPAVSPRWSVSLANYQQGRSRVLVGGVERVAQDTQIVAASASWELNNGLIRVRPGASANTLDVAAWDGAVWDSIGWNASLSGSATGAITAWDQVSILRNDFEMTTLRLLKDRAPGRALLDISLRRGARYVEVYLQADVATTLAWYRSSNEAATASTGYSSATANDGSGNRYVIGSAKTYSSNPNGGLSASATRTLDSFIGSVLNGASALAGDTAIDLRNQYIVQMVETTRGAAR